MLRERHLIFLYLKVCPLLFIRFCLRTAASCGVQAVVRGLSWPNRESFEFWVQEAKMTGATIVLSPDLFRSCSVHNVPAVYYKSCLYQGHDVHRIFYFLKNVAKNKKNR